MEFSSLVRRALEAGVSLHNNGSLMLVLDRNYGCVQCYIVNNKMFEFFVLIVYMYCNCYRIFGYQICSGKSSNIIIVVFLPWITGHQVWSFLRDPPNCIIIFIP